MTKTFRDLAVDGAFCDALEAQGIIHPFPIQELTLPLALDGHDLIGQARTGTGKTLAFGLPLLQRLDPAKPVTQALVIVPTRELCLQVHADLEIGETRGLTSVSVYGGVGYDEQIDALKSGVHVVVGTPGRLLDHLDRGNLELSNVTELVLDEADEMLDMGFLADVERLVESCRAEQRHTMLFSATMPTAIVKLARRYMDHPTFTRADHEPVETAPTVEQHFFQVHRMDKPRILARILQSRDRGGVYVFVRTKHMADRVVNDLDELSIPAIAIHGDLRQTTREKNLERFRAGKATVLVATEVAARGLDVTGVTHVINYDCPDDEKMYLHRIGRTARAGEAGVAVTFAEFNEADRLNVIRKAVGASDRDVEQIFSTSERLGELFDLPDETPWSRPTRKRGDDQEHGRRGRSRSDGRPKSARRSEGTGGDHDASRGRSEAGPRNGESSEPRRRASSERTRTRSRTRSRTRTEPDREGTTAGRRGPEDRSTSPETDHRPNQTESDGTRRRARSGRTKTQVDEAATSDTPRKGRKAANRPTGSGGRSTGSGTRSDTSRHGRGSRSGGSSKRPAADREHVRGDNGPLKLEQRGAEARGDGQPQLNRRVRVEHLP